MLAPLDFSDTNTNISFLRQTRLFSWRKFRLRDSGDGNRRHEVVGREIDFGDGTDTGLEASDTEQVAA